MIWLTQRTVLFIEVVFQEHIQSTGKERDAVGDRGKKQRGLDDKVKAGEIKVHFITEAPVNKQDQELS